MEKDGRKRILWPCLMVLGLLLIAAALFLAAYNLWDDRRAGAAASQILEQMPKPAMTKAPSLDPDEQVIPDYQLNPDMEMPKVKIQGNDYIGTLDIPALGLSLPVMGEWSYPKLKVAPCRYSGSAYTGNFTIAGHNYSTHFGPVRNLEAGDQVIFTDVKGRSFAYAVQTIETLEPTDIEDMLSDEWNLTLFTCTSSGQTRIAIRCLRAD